MMMRFFVPVPETFTVLGVNVRAFGVKIAEHGLFLKKVKKFT